MAKRKLDEWEVRGAVDTLKRADEIRKDSNLMKQVKIEAKKQAQALNKIVPPARPKISKKRGK